MRGAYNINLRAEVEWYLKLEAKMQARWSKILAELPYRLPVKDAGAKRGVETA